MTRRMSPNSLPQRLNFSGLTGATTIDADALRQPSEDELAGPRYRDAPSRRPSRFFMANPPDQNGRLAASASQSSGTRAASVEETAGDLGSMEATEYDLLVELRQAHRFLRLQDM